MKNQQKNQELNKNQMAKKIKEDFPEVDDNIISVLADYYSKVKVPEVKLDADFMEKAAAQMEENKRIRKQQQETRTLFSSITESLSNFFSSLSIRTKYALAAMLIIILINGVFLFNFFNKAKNNDLVVSKEHINNPYKSIGDNNHHTNNYSDDNTRSGHIEGITLGDVKTIKVKVEGKNAKILDLNNAFVTAVELKSDLKVIKNDVDPDAMLYISQISKDKFKMELININSDVLWAMDKISISNKNTMGEVAETVVENLVESIKRARN